MQSNFIFDDEAEPSFHRTTRSDLCDEETEEECDNLNDEENEEDGDDDFTFACATDWELLLDSSVSEDMSHDGNINPIFPLFDQSLIKLPQMPPVNKVFVEAEASAEEEAAGPYCAWSVDAASSSCRKSNSTGFSKIWRFKEMSKRSNSDGRDAFVFMKKTADKKTKDSETAAAAATKKKAEGKQKATKPPSASAHEVYVKSRAREDDRRKSYLPYKPELVGFFTNVHGGMSKNVHPF